MKVWVAGDAAAIEWQYLVLQISRLCIIVDDRRSRGATEPLGNR